MSLFSKLFGSKKIDEVRAESNDSLQEYSLEFNASEKKEVQIDNYPKTFPEAIRYVVNVWGKNYLQDRGFINVLNDLNVLKDIPAAKHIITNMQTNGYIEKISLAQNWEIESKSISIKYADEFGTKEDIVDYIINCFGYGLSYISDIPKSYQLTKTTSTKSEKPSMQPHSPLKSNSHHIGRTLDPKNDMWNYRYPTLDLLKKYDNDGNPYIDMAEQNANKDRIVMLLRTSGIEITSIKCTVGPALTLYEISLAPGILISKFRRIEKDLCLLLSNGTRFIVPIPGKGTIGIVMPNATPSVVSLESIFNTKIFQESLMELPCVLGKTITNETFIFDLSKATHVLVSGATGQGKSVCLNTIITSLIYKKHPAALKFVLIDPKKIEFSIYSLLSNHFLAKVQSNDNDPIVSTDMNALLTLNSLCKLMDTRFDLLKEVGARNIREYNNKYRNSRIPDQNGHGFMPYIVVVIDEYGDLMMTSGKEMEICIIRLSQLAHIVGIHLVIATRRLSSKIITEDIKLNFLTRIAFRVASESDSRLILDSPGAQQLIGRGDMLFQTYGSEPIRVQCSFVDTSETETICSFINKQESYQMPYELPNPDAPVFEKPLDDVDMSNLDPLFEDAARLVVINQSGSTSLIQRKFAIGYNRAGRLMAQLEKAGVVGAAYGSKPREVLIQDEVRLNNLLNNLR